MWLVLWLFLLMHLQILFTTSHPVSSMCHGLQPNVIYTYNYQTLMLLNNNDHKGKSPIGFGYSASFDISSQFQDGHNTLIKVSFNSGDAGLLTSMKGEKKHPLNSDYNLISDPHFDLDKFPLYAHLFKSTSDGFHTIKSFYFHNHESPTGVNLKKSIILLTLAKSSSKQFPGILLNDDKASGSIKVKTDDSGNLIKSYTSNGHSAIDSIFGPEILNSWMTESKLSTDHSIVLKNTGYQNVTIRSLIYNEAHSKLQMTFDLTLKSEVESPSKFSTFKSVDSVIASLGDDFIEESTTQTMFGVKFHPEKSICSECRSLRTLAAEYEDYLDDASSASDLITIAYLKLVDRIRIGGPGCSKEDIIELLNSYLKAKRNDLLSSLLDILIASRTESSISASLDFLNLPNNDNLDIAERYLTSFAAASVTIASTSSPISTDSLQLASLRFILEELSRLLSRHPQPNQWSSDKVRYSLALTIGSILNSYNKLSRRVIKLLDPSDIKKMMDISLTDEDDFNVNIVNLLAKQLDTCTDENVENEIECRIAILHALGNTGNLKLVLPVLSKYALDSNLKRESIAAMKGIRDCLHFRAQEGRDIPTSELFDQSLSKALRIMALAVVYDSSHETTSRIIAAEIIAKFLADDELSKQLIHLLQSEHLPQFGNNEMVTLMWKRALKLAASAKETPLNSNWLIHSTHLNGLSSAFTKSMGGTSSVNATYGVAMELLQGNLLKESTFDFLIGNDQLSQHILSIELYARGLESVAGSSDNSISSSNSDESTLAGMSLKILGMQLRPYVFFDGKGELMKHLWAGTASTPVTALRGNFIISDYEQGLPLINGFILDQKVRGVLSLDLSGSIEVSYWSRTADVLVETKVSSLIQGSQVIRSSNFNTKASSLYAFGGSSQIVTTTAADFYSSPFKMCIKMTQPEFTLKHNTRKVEKVNNEIIHKIHRLNYTFPARSFALHPKIQEVCTT